MSTIIFTHQKKWVTLEYDERVRVSNEKEFDTEDEACKDLLQELLHLKAWRIRHNLKQP